MNMVQLKFPNSQTINWKPLDTRKVSHMIIHHTACKVANPYDINSWHLFDNGWDGGFGYNYYIRKDGTIYVGRGENIGAHAQGYNEISLGVCCEGDFNKELLPIEQYRSLIELLKHLKLKLPKFKSILGHRDINQTDCPGKNIIIESITKEVNEMAEITDINEALDVWIEEGFINSKEYWLKTIDTVTHQRELFLKVANKIRLLI